MKNCPHQRTHSSYGLGGAWVSIETVVCLECGEELERHEMTAGYRTRELPIQKKEVKQDGNQTHAV